MKSINKQQSLYDIDPNKKPSCQTHLSEVSIKSKHNGNFTSTA